MAVRLSIFILSKLDTMWERVIMAKERVGTMLELLEFGNDVGMSGTSGKARGRCVDTREN